MAIAVLNEMEPARWTAPKTEPTTCECRSGWSAHWISVARSLTGSRSAARTASRSVHRRRQGSGRSRQSADGTDQLIQGLFSKLPEPSGEWPLPARQKWLQTAANIFDLMYAPGEADAGEGVIRVERTSARQAEAGARC